MEKVEKLSYIRKIIVEFGKQGCRSINEEETCLYRDPAGNKCALGHLITNKAYDSNHESEGIYNFGVQDMMRKSGLSIDKKDLLFFGELQMIHDDASNFTDMMESYKEFLVTTINE